ERTALLARRGFDWDSLDQGFQAKLMRRIIMGGPDEVRQQVQKILALGIDGLTLNMPANGHHPEIVALAGQTLAPLFSSD
ncbi:MAG: LLM class F420-dependent oxidoreductase, partial [Acidimicrobiales bacterium]